MDKQEYRKRIEELALIKDRKPTKSPTHNRLAKEIVIELDEDGNEIEVEREVTENATLGFDLVGIKPILRACELGCGDIVANQRIERRFNRMPEPHWRTKCVNCSCYVSPDGEGFIEQPSMVAAAYLKYFNDKRGGAPKVKLGRPRHTEITEYGHSRPSKWTTSPDGTIKFNSDQE